MTDNTKPITALIESKTRLLKLANKLDDARKNLEIAIRNAEQSLYSGNASNKK